jgi:GTP-binding protein
VSKFVDEVELFLVAGHGGAGAVSFHKEKFVEFGGPDGGDGGRGGDVIICSEQSMPSLDKYLSYRKFEAENGHSGSGNNKFGKAGEPLVLKVPVGTQLYDTETGELIHDFLTHNDSITVLKGGRGGKGNAFFKSSTHQTPKFSQPGEEGESKTIRFSLKLLADIGIVGLPNAGKSTLLSKITQAHPKIAGYAFTTLAPNLGVVIREDSSIRYTIADIPGIIEGASKGSGLGLSFLRHIERVKAIIYLFDGSSLDILEDFKILSNELKTYNPILLELPSIFVINKADLWDLDESYSNELLSKYSNLDQKLMIISADKGYNIDKLLKHLDSFI